MSENRENILENLVTSLSVDSVKEELLVLLRVVLLR